MLNSQPAPIKSSSRRFTTDKQREAARCNGAKSKGPVTAAGKARSSRNNFKHGIYSNTVDLTSEEGYYKKFRNYLNDFPGDSLELFELIERMVTAALRRRQFGQIHAGVWNDYLVTQPENTPLHKAYGEIMHLLLPLEAAENREFYRFRRIARILQNLKKDRPNPTSPEVKFAQYFREQNNAPNEKDFHNLAP